MGGKYEGKNGEERNNIASDERNKYSYADMKCSRFLLIKPAWEEVMVHVESKVRAERSLERKKDERRRKDERRI